MSVGPLHPDELARRLSDAQRRIVELEARRQPEPRHSRFLLVVTFDGSLFAGYHKGRFVPPDFAGAYTITSFRLHMTAASSTTTIPIDVGGSDAATITIPASQTLYSGDLKIALAPGGGPKPRIGTAGTGGADLVLTFGCQRSVLV